MFHLSLSSHVYCRVCSPFLWEYATPDLSKHSQTAGLAQELQGVCPCCGSSRKHPHGWVDLWVMCCDPWLSVQTPGCSMPASLRAIPCVCCGWNIPASPSAGHGAKAWLTDVFQSNCTRVHGCWLNPRCFWTVLGAQLVKPQGKLLCWGLPSFIPTVVGSSAVCAA